MLLQDRLAKIKICIDSYLADTNELMDERWSLYQALPSFLRNHRSFQQDFLYKSDGSTIELCDLNDFNRHEFIEVHGFLEKWSRDLLDHSLDTIATKEYILSKNLGSFENDW